MSLQILDLVNEKLTSKFGKDILLADLLYDFPTITVSRDKIIDIIQLLYDDTDLQFRFLTSLCAVHFPHAEKNQQMGMVYHLHSLTNNYRVRLKIYFPVSDVVVPTLTGIFEAANWLERETYDYFGVIFKGHPNLKRILNVDDMVVFPMRKEFPLEDPTRDDKDDSMFGRSSHPLN